MRGRLRLPERFHDPRWVIPGCLAVYLLLACLLYLPAGPFDGSRLPMGGSADPALSTWYLAWLPYALGHGIGVFHSDFVNYPSGIDLANNAYTPLLGLLASPVTVTLGPIVAFNVMIRLAFATAAASMFLVLRPYCRHWVSAFGGGLLYGFSPYMVSQGQEDAHLHQAFIALLPVIAWCFYELTVRQQHRAILIGVAFGALAGAQALIAPEALSDLLVVLLLALIMTVWANRHRLLVWARRLIFGLSGAIAAFVVTAGYLVWSMLFGAGHVVGPVQATGLLQPLSADVLSAVVPTARQLVAPSGLTTISSLFGGGYTPEQSGYLGLPLLLCLVAIVVVCRHRRVVRWSAVLAAFAYLLSLGGRLTFDNHVTSIPLPEAVFAHLPILDSTVPSRYAVDVVLFVSVMVALGLDHSLEWLTSHRRHPRWRWAAGGVAGASGLSLLALLPAVPFATSVTPWPASITTTLDAISPGSVVLSYPYPERNWDQPMLWQAESGMRFRLLGGYVTVQGPDGAGTNLPPLPSPASVPEYLVQEQDGLSAPYPPPPTTPPGNSDLCEFLRVNLVNAVMIWQTMPDAGVVESYVENDLGQPAIDSSSLLIWLSPASGWC